MSARAGVSEMERAGIEPATSGLQSASEARTGGAYVVQSRMMISFFDTDYP